jgi:hypothetical protein
MSRVVNGDSFQVGSGHLAAIYPATVTLTNAQIKALPTTGITLVAAPSAGSRIKVLGATLVARFTAGAYTNVNVTTASLPIQASSGAWLVSPILNDSGSSQADLTGFFGAFNIVADLAVPSFFPNGTGGWTQYALTTTVANVDGLAVQLKMDNNGSGNLTGGNAANTLKVTLYYSVETL